MIYAIQLPHLLDSCFLSTRRTIDAINLIFSNFLWNGRSHSISWDFICRRKVGGGLGLCSPDLLCKAVIAKRMWTFLSNKHSIWAIWMRSKYIKAHNQFWNVFPKQSDSKVWKEILNHRDEMLKFMKIQIGNESNTLFWHDLWIDQG